MIRVVLGVWDGVDGVRSLGAFVKMDGGKQESGTWSLVFGVRCKSFHMFIVWEPLLTVYTMQLPPARKVEKPSAVQSLLMLLET